MDKVNKNQKYYMSGIENIEEEEGYEHHGKMGEKINAVEFKGMQIKKKSRG